MLSNRARAVDEDYVKILLLMRLQFQVTYLIDHQARNTNL